MIAVGSSYRLSGQVDAAGLVLLPVVAVVAGAGGGAVYGLADWLIPFIYVKFLLTLGLGFVVGWAVGWAGRVGKVRNVPIVVASSVVAGLAAIWAAWVGWLFAASDWQVIVLSPLDLLMLQAELAETGVWSIGSGTPTGLVLQAVWLIEALLIGGVCVITGWGRTTDRVFCEQCHAWVDDSVAVGPLGAMSDPPAVAHALELGRIEPLQQLGPMQADHPLYTRVTLQRCDHCNDLHLLTVKAVERYAVKGETKEREHIVTQRLLISGPMYEAIAALEPIQPSAPSDDSAAESTPA